MTESLRNKPQTSALATRGADTASIFQPRNFGEAVDIAEKLSKSSLVPKDFQGNPGNLLIAFEIANRCDAPIFSVVQNINIIHGRPSWSAQWIIGLLMTSGRFEDVDFHESEGACYVTATDTRSRKEKTGPTVTLEMAKRDGWTKNAKWQSMPQVMLRYRAATFFARQFCPDLLMGMKEAEELRDVYTDDAPPKPRRSRKPKPTEGSDDKKDPPTIDVTAETTPAPDPDQVKEEERAEADAGLAPATAAADPAPEEPPPAPATEPAPQADTLPDDLVGKVQGAIGQHAGIVVPYLIHREYLKPGQGIQHLSKTAAERIINQSTLLITSARKHHDANPLL